MKLSPHVHSPTRRDWWRILTLVEPAVSSSIMATHPHLLATHTPCDRSDNNCTTEHHLRSSESLLKRSLPRHTPSNKETASAPHCEQPITTNRGRPPTLFAPPHHRNTRPTTYNSFHQLGTPKQTRQTSFFNLLWGHPELRQSTFKHAVTPSRYSEVQLPKHQGLLLGVYSPSSYEQLSVEVIL